MEMEMEMTTAMEMEMEITVAMDRVTYVDKGGIVR
jgi:hypothetical protein